VALSKVKTLRPSQYRNKDVSQHSSEHLSVASNDKKDDKGVNQIYYSRSRTENEAVL